MEGELDKRHAASDEAAAEGSAGLSASVAITGGTLVVKVQDAVQKFTGDDAPSAITSSGDGMLTSSDLNELYKSTTSYTFKPGNVYKIAFYDANRNILGTWDGTVNPGTANTFKGYGNWST